jgi:hypothetical protein
VPLFSVRRADIETFARELEARGRARATVTRRLCTIAGFYKYAVEEEILDHSPAAHVRRPRLDGRRLDRHGAARIVRRVTCRAGFMSASLARPPSSPRRQAQAPARIPARVNSLPLRMHTPRSPTVNHERPHHHVP